MSIIDQYTSAADQAQNASAQLFDMFQQSTKTFADQIDVLATLPSIDSAPVKNYYELLQQAIDANRQFTFQWIDGVNSVAGFVREQAGTVKSLLRG